MGIDPASNSAYAPVGLNAPALLATDGHQPSESDSCSHQQVLSHRDEHNAVGATCFDQLEPARPRPPRSPTFE
jgi:hypothetical protein